MKEANETLRDLKTGIVLITVLLEVTALIFAPNKLPFCLGILLGGTVAFGLSINMYNSLDLALDMDSDSASKYIRKKTGIRMLIMGVTVLPACIFPAYLNMMGVVAGLLGLKLSAYAQPVIHKYIATKIFRKGR